MDRRGFLVSHGIAAAMATIVAYLVSGSVIPAKPEFGLPFLGVFLGTSALIGALKREHGSIHRVRPVSPTIAFGLGSWLYLIIGPIPSIRDPSVLRVPEAAEHYAEAYFFAGLALWLYFWGVRLARRRTVPIGTLSKAPLSFVRIVMAALCALLAFVWSMRAYLGSIGRFANYSAETGELEGATMFLAYAFHSLRWAVIPMCEYLRTRSAGRLRIFWSVLSVVELSTYVLASQRTYLMVAVAQFGLARAYFSAWSWRRLFVAGSIFAVAFFGVVNPAIYVMREAIIRGRVGYGNQLRAYASLFIESLTRDSAQEEVVTASTERDIKYRLNSLYFIAAMIGSDERGTCEHGYGTYTLRNAATVIPTFLWSGKREYAISNMKLELPHRLGVPAVDYMQSLGAHWYADFGWFALVLMLLTGFVDQRIALWLTRREAFVSTTLFLFAIVPSYLAPTEDFAGHFLLKFRETAPLFLSLFAVERRLTRKARRQARLESAQPTPSLRASNAS